MPIPSDTDQLSIVRHVFVSCSIAPRVVSSLRIHFAKAESKRTISPDPNTNTKYKSKGQQSSPVTYGYDVERAVESAHGDVSYSQDGTETMRTTTVEETKEQAPFVSVPFRLLFNQVLIWRLSDNHSLYLLLLLLHGKKQQRFSRYDKWNEIEHLSSQRRGVANFELGPCQAFPSRWQSYPLVFIRLSDIL